MTFGRFVVVCCAGLNVCDSVVLSGAGRMPRAFWFWEAAGRKVSPGGHWYGRGARGEGRALGQGVRRGMRPVTLSFVGIRMLPREARRGQGAGVGAAVPPGGVWTRWREKGQGVWAGCGEMFGFWRGAVTAGVRDGGGCGRMRDGKCPFGAMISGGETWKVLFSRGAGCVL